jgi:hypothetical protein
MLHVCSIYYIINMFVFLQTEQSPGQGCKICPNASKDFNPAHTVASRDMLQDRLRNDIEFRQKSATPAQQIFEKTRALLSATLDQSGPWRG